MTWAEMMERARWWREEREWHLERAEACEAEARKWEEQAKAERDRERRPEKASRRWPQRG